MDGNIRTLLRDKAEEMRIGTTIPAEVLRRSRRRRTATAGVAALVTIGVAAGAFVGARTLLRETAGGEPQVRPGGSAVLPEDVYPFIYPPTLAELESTQAQAEEGHVPLWQSPRGVAEMFAVNVMGWDPDDVEADVRGDQPITAVITNPTLSEAAGSKDDIRTELELIEVPDQDPPFFVVLATQAEIMEIESMGPDAEFGADGSVAFRGRLAFLPDGATVVLNIDHGGSPVATASATPEVDGRFHLETQLPGGIGPATRISVALVDESGLTLTLTAAHVAVAASETTSEASEPVQVGPRVQIPDAVADTRQAILDAAQARDYGTLRDLIPERGFTFSYGGERDPIAYWKYLESVAHVPVFGDVFPMVLGTDPGPVRGGYIWPAQAGEDPSQWDERDLEALSQIHARQDIRRFQQIGLYTGWRVEIARDGTWLSFVQGD
jgi:hypothetical protein